MTLLLHGWEVERHAGHGRLRPMATIIKSRKRYAWKSARPPAARSWTSDPPRSMFSALCDVQYEWSEWFVRENKDYLCLHSGAVQIGDGAVIFPSDQKAGKSVLTAQFAAAGYRIFGDDVLAITPQGNRLMSLGLAPRLRLPLPPLNDPGFAKFVVSRRGPADRRYQYLLLPQSEFAPFRTTIGIHAVVLLDRQESGPASLSEVGQGETLKQLIRKNFADTIPVLSIFNRLKRLSGRLQNYRLQYSRGHDAIDLLAQKFGGNP